MQDGIGMGLGDALSTKAENEYIMKERDREEWEMKVNEAGERKEMVDIYVEKGMSREDASIIIDLMAKYKDLFIDTMMVDELGLQVPNADDNPWFDGMYY